MSRCRVKGFSKTRYHATLQCVTTIPQDLLDKAIERLKAEFQPEQIYLFGSHAWGMPHEDSDVDLMVIVPKSRERAIHRMQRAHRCLRGLRMSKDIFVQTREEFDRYKDLRASLQHQILERGRKLYG
jgi:predicted nucleotidyltransferase